MALRSLGASINSRDPSVIARATRKLLQQKPLVKAYTSENYDQLLASGEVLLALQQSRAEDHGGVFCGVFNGHVLDIRFVLQRD